MIILRNVNKTYDDGTKALVNSSLAVGRGEFVFLVGANGAGKSTLIKLLLKEEEASSGAILVDGRNVDDLDGNSLSEYRRRIGIVFQDPRLVASKTALENVMLPLEADSQSDDSIEDRAAQALERADATELADKFPSELSGGQQQRVAVARALIHRPGIILADEPTGNLSPAATIEVMDLFDRMYASGVTVLLATHNAEVVDEMNRRVIALERGQIVRDTAVSGYPDFLRRAA